MKQSKQASKQASKHARAHAIDKGHLAWLYTLAYLFNDRTHRPSSSQSKFCFSNSDTCHSHPRNHSPLAACADSSALASALPLASESQPCSSCRFFRPALSTIFSAASRYPISQYMAGPHARPARHPVKKSGRPGTRNREIQTSRARFGCTPLDRRTRKAVGWPRSLHHCHQSLLSYILHIPLRTWPRARLRVDCGHSSDASDGVIFRDALPKVDECGVHAHVSVLLGGEPDVFKVVLWKKEKKKHRPIDERNSTRLDSPPRVSLRICTPSTQALAAAYLTLPAAMPRTSRG